MKFWIYTSYAATVSNTKSAAAIFLGGAFNTAAAAVFNAAQAAANKIAASNKLDLD